jgi:hypothetical protein
MFREGFPRSTISPDPKFLSKNEPQVYTRATQFDNDVLNSSELHTSWHVKAIPDESRAAL